jgi:transposase
MTSPVTVPSCFVGCDVGKTDIVVFDQSTRQIRTIHNSPDDLAAFATALDPGCLAVCEATGGYEALLLDALVQAGRSVHRADARKVKAFIRSFGTLGKTDAIDARLLAEYGRERHASLARWQPQEAARKRLQALVLLRQDLVAARTAWNNRRQAPGTECVAEGLDAVVKCFDDQIDKLNTQIVLEIRTSKPLARICKVLQGIPGIGIVTAFSLIALMPELGTIDRRKAASLAGLAPHPRQSGGADAYRRTRGGRPEIKRVLFMAAMAARKNDPQMKAFVSRLVADGKKPLVALTALMRKMLVVANARIRDDMAQQLS